MPLSFCRLFGGLAVAALLACGTARAAEPPANVLEDVRGAAAECRQMGGKPDTEAMLTVDDLNGDGAEDWIVDYAQLRCAGTTNPFCGTGGCGLKIYLWISDSTWRLAFDDNVRAYRRSLAGGRRTIRMTFGGSACGEVNYRDCNVVYEVRRTSIVRR